MYETRTSDRDKSLGIKGREWEAAQQFIPEQKREEGIAYQRKHSGEQLRFAIPG